MLFHRTKAIVQLNLENKISTIESDTIAWHFVQMDICSVHF